ncbi:MULTISPECIES: MFS transporter [Clostridium]|uniref:EmrB/QacA subfamily drug resistance transporter n=2 Tax=Clostridium TaxID=1485 RepID=A0AAX0B5Y6_CLOBE|nr:MFS transporter [Clostridium beijerinckii]MBA8936310.1 EmrB/QacA subfamily drug resistance transporter [Clostridium beijerinckii]NOW06825.1 EmrB/QacA subfamily drug resistance transporter [Clostridium beijerinckii]NRT32165.1 EmrB/QacA subfamily drug resistance transporter [Clostridium beijerinckii]NRT48407.1 EmrB/QacA subfamily drug resistance transporter [Clostridium beijerinckii]NRT90604.1 EmrB/QacA subfamily drug resistance transporter [Clostridium beijerinckii]
MESTDKKRWLILFTTVLLTFMSTLDSSIVNVALPVMSQRLAVSMASIEWVVTSYLIVIVGTILIFGRLADIKGKTSVFKLGIIIFTIGSLLCGLSNSLVMLVFSRILQAIGAAGTMSTSQGIITQVFPRNERGRALGLNGTFVALGSMIGPPVGGIIVSILSWQYIFLINVPIGILALALAMKTLPKSSNNSNEKLDIKGAILFGSTMVLLFSALTFGKEIGYDNIGIIISFVVSIILFISFIIVEKRIDEPLLKLEIFSNSLFSLSIFCAFISFVAISCSNIILPFYLQYVMKLAPSVTGVLMMVSPIILSVVAPMSGYISDRIGSEVLTFLGLIGTSLGLFLISTLNEYSHIGALIAFIAIMTLGNGMFQSPNNSLVMSTVDTKNLGIAGSINALVRNLGMVFGISLSTTLLYNRMSSQIGYHVTGYIEGRDDIFVYGMQYVYVAAAIICALGAVLTAYRLYKTKSRVKVEAL